MNQADIDGTGSGQSQRQQGTRGQGAGIPPAYPPRAQARPYVTVQEAARDVFGVSERTFQSFEGKDWMPAPLMLGPRLKRYVRAELEAAFVNMPRGRISEPGQLERLEVGRSQARACRPGTVAMRSSATP